MIKCTDMKHFTKTLFGNILRVFSLRYISWHLLAIILTYATVVSNLDWKYFLFVRNTTLNTVFFPALIIGGLLPIILPVSLLAIGYMRKSIRIKTIGFALTQSAIIGSVVSSTYKAFTGRVQPNMQDLILDSSHQFNFGFLEHGIFWGWPSSHTTIAFAMAVTAIYVFPNIRKMPYIALLYALYIGFGVSLSIHWFSEFIAGAIIGSIIGIVVGKSFRTLLTQNQ